MKGLLSLVFVIVIAGFFYSLATDTGPDCTVVTFPGGAYEECIGSDGAVWTNRDLADNDVTNGVTDNVTREDWTP